MEEEELAQIPKFKARPLNKRVRNLHTAFHFHIMSVMLKHYIRLLAYPSVRFPCLHLIIQCQHLMVVFCVFKLLRFEHRYSIARAIWESFAFPNVKWLHLKWAYFLLIFQHNKNPSAQLGLFWRQFGNKTSFVLACWICLAVIVCTFLRFTKMNTRCDCCLLALFIKSLNGLVFLLKEFHFKTDERAHLRGAAPPTDQLLKVVSVEYHHCFLNAIERHILWKLCCVFVNLVVL